ncbi:hypothetical protein [Streptomyces sp. NPDC001787]|uniref:hypothetical protein n=1 Tax=Streptomyces sp. NPDC001787 TaxID=3154523 RepID=UPI0033316137
MTLPLGHLLHQPVTEEPHGGPDPAGWQIAGQYAPELTAGDPAPQPLDGLPDESTGLGDTEVQIAMGMPQRQQHPLRLSFFGQRAVSTAFRVGRFGGWVGCVLLPFFVYR